MLFLGLDLAWSATSSTSLAESGVVALDESGEILDADWKIGLQNTESWIGTWARGDALLLVDAPLVVDNPDRQRLCEKRVGQLYGAWKVAANTTNMGSRHLAGVQLRQDLRASGWRYDDGANGPPGTSAGLVMSECYPYTSLVGAEELRFDAQRPAYKRWSAAMRLGSSNWRVDRAKACDDVITALARLSTANPPLRLPSHPNAADLLATTSPTKDREYKHREDLIDALLCAWTAALWWRYGLTRCQVLGRVGGSPPQPTIIAPFRPEQRGSVSSAQSG